MRRRSHPLAHFAARGVRDAFVFAVPNGGVRSPIEAAAARAGLDYEHRARRAHLEGKRNIGKRRVARCGVPLGIFPFDDTPGAPPAAFEQTWDDLFVLYDGRRIACKIKS